MSDFTELERFDAGQTDADLKTLRQLEEHGADLTKPTHFIHYLFLPDEERARTCGRMIAERLGYAVKGRAPEKEGEDWMVMAERDQVPTPENVARMRTALSMIVAEHGGEYDGWEAAVTR